MSVVHHRKTLTIGEKCAIIQRLENGETNLKLAKEYGVGHSTISMIYKNKVKIRASYNENVLKRKRIRKSTQNKVEQALLDWYNVQKTQGTRITGPILIQKANEFASLFQINFTCNPSWITRFKVRHNIDFGKISHNETTFIDPDIVEVKLETPDNLDAHTSDENLNSYAAFNSDPYEHSNTPTEHMQISELNGDSMPKSMDSSDSSIQKKENEADMDLKRKEIEIADRKLILEERRLALDEARLELERQERLQRLKFEERERDAMFSLLKGQQELMSLFLTKFS